MAPPVAYPSTGSPMADHREALVGAEAICASDDDDSDVGDQLKAEELDENGAVKCEYYAGNLSKWTNYLHGWQDRYIVLRDGTLSYYKSEHETAYGCRGAISLAGVNIRPHEFDECRFDVTVNDSVWYMRAETEEKRDKWIQAILASRHAESGYASESSLQRHGSMMSLTSLSTASTSSFKRGRGLKEKLAEMETYRDILCTQVDALQSYFDALASQNSGGSASNGQQTAAASAAAHELTTPSSSKDFLDDDDESDFEADMSQPQQNSHPPAKSNSSTETSTNIPPSNPVVLGLTNANLHHLGGSGHRRTPSSASAAGSTFSSGGTPKHNASNINPSTQQAMDFKGEAITFKATTAGILATLGHCIELMNQREEAWHQKLSKEVEKRRKIQELYKQAVIEQSTVTTPASLIQLRTGPDYQEGPHSALNEEEFFDAVDAAIDHYEQEVQFQDSSKQSNHSLNSTLTPTPTVVPTERPSIDSYFEKPLPPEDKHFDEIEKTTEEHIKYAKSSVEADLEWQPIAEDGEMKVYVREVEVDGVVCDPLKATHTVYGVTAREMCHYFFDPSCRLDWEVTLEVTNTISQLADDTVISHQIHKRVWPAAQRDCLFLSHMRPLTDEKVDCSNSGDAASFPGHAWIVVNFSVDEPEVPLASRTRARVHVSLLCQTELIKPLKPGESISRDNLRCKIVYQSYVNPGGWVPASVLRAVYKREYPRFVKRFSQYVIDQSKDKPILY